MTTPPIEVARDIQAAADELLGLIEGWPRIVALGALAHAAGRLAARMSAAEGWVLEEKLPSLGRTLAVAAACERHRLALEERADLPPEKVN